MFAVNEYSDAQLFALVFFLLSAPVFLYFYLRAPLQEAVYPRALLPEAFQPRAPLPEPPAKLRAREEQPASVEPVHARETSAWLRPQHYAEPITPLAAQSPAPPASLPAPIARKQAPDLELAGYLAKALYWVPADRDFRIVVEAASLLDDGEENGQSEPENFASFVAGIEQGQTVSLILECPAAGETGCPLVLDATFQVFRLESRPMTVIFAAHSLAVEIPTKVEMCMRVSAGGTELGAIGFEVTVYPTNEALHPVEDGTDAGA